MRISVYADPKESLLSVHSKLLFTFLSLNASIYANSSFCHDSPHEIDVYPFTPSLLLKEEAKAKIPQKFQISVIAKCWKARGTELQVLIILNKG